MKMDIKNMVRDFASLGEAKKRSSVYVKAVSLLCAAIVGSVVILGGLPFATSPLCIHLC